LPNKRDKEMTRILGMQCGFWKCQGLQIENEPEMDSGSSHDSDDPGATP
jgi:hypothetical protein